MVPCLLFAILCDIDYDFNDFDLFIEGVVIFSMVNITNTYGVISKSVIM